MHELIGMKTEIVKSSNKQVKGLKGTISDETKSMFVIETDNGYKAIPKEINEWKFLLNDNEIIIEGAKLIKRSYERLRTKLC